jgi:hypothetical protein
VASLDVMVEGILDAIADALAAAAEETGGGLDAVRDVIVGDRQRALPNLPALWIVPQPATYEQADYGDAELWMLDVALAALVKNDDPETGARVARQLAARARQVAIEAAREVDDVVDAVSRTFDPHARRSERNNALHWTDATIRVTFVVSE